MLQWLHLLRWSVLNVLRSRQHRYLSRSLKHNHTLKMSSMDGRMTNLRRGRLKVETFLQQAGLRSGSSLREQVRAPTHHKRSDREQSHREEDRVADQKIVRESGLRRRDVVLVSGR